MTSRVVVSIRVPCSPLAAFEAFTREIGEWWAPSDMLKLTPRGPGLMRFEPPDAQGRGGRLVELLPSGQVFEVGVVRSWTPGQRLIVGWRQATFGPEHATEVEVTFEPFGSETRVTVEHRGWDSVPQDHVARHGFTLPLFQRYQGDQWRSGLAALAQQIARQTPPPRRD